MSNFLDIEIQNIDHLGIIAGIIDSIGLVEIINEIIGQEPGEKVSPAQIVKAMILNGLGFVSSPLYMFPDFFKDKPCEHLIGEGVKAEYLNDDKLGRVMDKLFIKGLTDIFLAITINVIQQFNIILKSSHLDSTSLHLHGEYNNRLPDVIIHNNSSNAKIKSPQTIEITYGYSRDHRPDLKQFIIDLISSGKSLSNDDMLSEYKAQQSCVRVACRFGKGGLDFLKTHYFLQIVFFLNLQKEKN